MAVWEVVKGLQLDLNGISNDNLQKLIKSFDENEIREILTALDEEIEKNKDLGAAVQLAIRISTLFLQGALTL